jgi:hypothetical protein
MDYYQRHGVLGDASVNCYQERVIFHGGFYEILQYGMKLTGLAARRSANPQFRRRSP